MEQKETILKGIDEDIRRILYQYMKTQSFTCTAREKEAERFLVEHLSKIPYFQEHPEYYGTFPISGDPFERAVCFGMVKGQGEDTVVFLHHSDVVQIEDLKLLKAYAFSPDELEEKLKGIKDSLPHDARKDLEDGTFLFGRGSADMKGGGSIQLALLERYSRLPEMKGNVIVIAVPDEENLSAGMRAGVELLAQLQEKYNLRYKIMINSEPHQRKNDAEGIFSEGSEGKIMPFVYVRGYLSHIGKVFEGFNPLNLMSEIVRRTELNMDFSDMVGNESAPPPTWLYLKDSKKQYDVSMPLSAFGGFSVLTLNRTPGQVMEKVEAICRDSFDRILKEMHESYSRFSKVTDPVADALPWKAKVVDFAGLYREAIENHGEIFRKNYEKQSAFLWEKMKEGSLSLMESNFQLIAFIFDYIEDLSPCVVYGLIPPYYPNVSNLYLKNKDPDVESLSRELDAYAKEKYGQHYTTEYFYTGISDLSYTSMQDGKEILVSLEKSMPLLGEFYGIPTAAIEKISMPCMNIAPWGKDFHKLTERVNREDLYHRTPHILNKAVSLLLHDPALTDAK